MDALSRENESLRVKAGSCDKEVEELKKKLSSLHHNSKQSIIKLEEKTSKEFESVRQLTAAMRERDEQIVSLKQQLQIRDTSIPMRDEVSRLIDDANVNAALQEAETERLKLANRISVLEAERDNAVRERDRIKAQADLLKENASTAKSEIGAPFQVRNAVTITDLNRSLSHNRTTWNKSKDSKIPFT